MHRFIPGQLAKLPEKRKITQTEKRQRDCVYDRRSKRNQGYIKEWEEKEYACLAYDDETNATFCSSTSCRGRGVWVGKIPVQLESGERMRSRPELTTLGRISKLKSLWWASKLFSLLARPAI